MTTGTYDRRQVIEQALVDAVRATGFLTSGVHNTVLGNDLMRTIARQDELARFEFGLQPVHVVERARGLAVRGGEFES